MKITRDVERTQAVTETIDVICNRCGKSCVVCDDASNCGPHGLIETTVSGGFYSPVLPDLVSFTFSLCEPCLGVLFSAFKHRPQVDHHAPHDGASPIIDWINGRAVTVEVLNDEDGVDESKLTPVEWIPGVGLIDKVAR